MTDFLAGLSSSHYGDLASVVGVLISIVGFIATLLNVASARSASEQAEAAARSARESILLFETVVDFTFSINTLEEIKRFHRVGEWRLLPDRYALTRRFLIGLRHSAVDLTDVQLAVIQGALTNLSAIERRVERFLQGGSPINSARFNEILSADIDGLIKTLAELKAAKAGMR